MTEPKSHDDFGGLTRDLPHLIDRRRALLLIGGAGLAGVAAACGSSSRPAASPTAGPPAASPFASPTATGTAGSPSATPTFVTPTTTPTALAASPTATAMASPTATASTAPTAEATPAATPTTPEATTAPTAEPTATVASPGAEIPSETAGPFPANGSNGPNVLATEGVVRTDLTRSIGTLSGTAQGIPTAVHLTVVDAAGGNPLPGASVYLWHCTADGRYSIYEISDQNFLRGVQAADAAGRVVFKTVFPGCYRGRWPHCHFEVHDNLDNAIAGRRPMKTSQLAIPRANCETVYADSRYGSSAGNLARLTLASDNVFRDGWQDQLATVSGSNADGYAISLLVRV
ncbi:hypothetical protein [Candidatus Poriferisocius sp.]|uniref:dioxygenase family protein n=1 Tax=Candidatus Poriferisocius sp. TaxID=3101276 RepID=UPI003B5C8F1D